MNLRRALTLCGLWRNFGIFRLSSVYPCGKFADKRILYLALFFHMFLNSFWASLLVTRMIEPYILLNDDRWEGLWADTKFDCTRLLQTVNYFWRLSVMCPISSSAEQLVAFFLYIVSQTSRPYIMIWFRSQCTEMSLSTKNSLLISMNTNVARIM